LVFSHQFSVIRLQLSAARLSRLASEGRIADFDASSEFEQNPEEEIVLD